MSVTRRELLMGALGSAAASAQARYPGVNYPDYSRVLPDYLRRLARTAYERRNAEITRLTTPAAIAKRIHWIEQTFWDLAGGQPERTPLNARTIGSFNRPGYRLEKIVYESQPGLHVPANLYIPDTGQPPYPAVLFQMGHSNNGKANDGYQKCCQGLARLGYVVLAFDPMGQGERISYTFNSATAEHTYPGKQMLLLGDTVTRMQVWDAVRSLDYLASRPEVDPKRMASTGQSGGGTLTMLLACVDQRLAAAAVSCGNTENFACANFNPPGSTDDAEQDLVGSGRSGFDRWDLLYPLAPKPLLMLISARDWFGTYSPSYLSSGWEEYQKLQHVYATLGRQQQLAWADTPLPHGLAYYPRLRIYQWFERWLKGSTNPVEREPEVAPEPDQTLWVGKTGNTVRDFGGATPFAMVRRRASELRPSSPDPARLRNLLALDTPPAKVKIRVLGSVPSGPLSVQAVDVQSLPAWLFIPAKVDSSKPFLLVLDELGRNQHWHEGELGERLALAGQVVCAADLCGIGDLKPELSRGAAGHSASHAQEEDYAWASLILGNPLLGKRVSEILALVNALRPRGKIAIMATGRLTVPALIAAALSDDVQELQLRGGLASLRSVVETENYRCPLVHIVPGLLAHTDLPEIAASIGPRRIELIEPVNGAGQILKASEARILYPFKNVECKDS